jgi:hypothetical protein
MMIMAGELSVPVHLELTVSDISVKLQNELKKVEAMSGMSPAKAEKSGKAFAKGMESPLKRIFTESMNAIRYMRFAPVIRSVGRGMNAAGEAGGAEAGEEGGLLGAIGGSLASIAAETIIIAVAIVALTLIMMALMQGFAGFTSAFDSFFALMKVIGKLIGMMALPLALIFVPLFLVLARLFIPVLRVLYTLFRPVMNKLMASAAKNSGKGAAGLVAMGVDTASAFSELVFIMFAKVVEGIVKLLWDLQKASMEIMLVVIGGILKLLLSLIPGGKGLASAVDLGVKDAVMAMEIGTGYVFAMFDLGIQAATESLFAINPEINNLATNLTPIQGLVTEIGKVFGIDLTDSFTKANAAVASFQTVLDTMELDAKTKFPIINSLFLTALTNMETDVDAFVTKMKEEAARLLSEAKAALDSAKTTTKSIYGNNTNTFGLGSVTKSDSFLQPPAAYTTGSSSLDKVLSLVTTTQNTTSPYGGTLNLGGVTINSSAVNTKELVKDFSKEMSYQLSTFTQQNSCHY